MCGSRGNVDTLESPGFELLKNASMDIRSNATLNLGKLDIYIHTL